jgi:hypothetical protein
MNVLRKVISGGQTGVDQAALRAAKDCGLEIGGWCPPGRESENGVIPADFPLQETPQELSPDAPDVPRSQRTEWNVRDSDGTLVILAGNAATDPGTAWAIECAKRFEKPVLVSRVDDPNVPTTIRQWLDAWVIQILSVGGPSESTAHGIGKKAYALLKKVLSANRR